MKRSGNIIKRIKYIFSRSTAVILAVLLLIVCIAVSGCASSSGTEPEGSTETEPSVPEETVTEETVTEESSEPEDTSEETSEESGSPEEETFFHLGIEDGYLKYEDVRGYFFRTEFHTDWPENDYDQSAFQMVNDRMTYTSDKYTYRLGIDVYEAYGDIDWPAVKNDGYDFVILRLGYRGYSYPDLMQDDMIFANLLGAVNAGLDVGVYFFSQAINEEEAAEEADYVINTILQPVGYTPEKIVMGVAYDPEYIGSWNSRTNFLMRDQITRNAKAFCDRIAGAGYKAYIYSNMVWEDRNFDLSQLSDYEIWYADYTSYPQSPYAFSIWQYGHGQSAGVEGAVDVNIQLIPIPEEPESEAVGDTVSEAASESEAATESAPATETAPETETMPESISGSASDISF